MIGETNALQDALDRLQEEDERAGSVVVLRLISCPHEKATGFET